MTTTFEHTSNLAGVGSFDVTDFAIPSGREEEWRFVPLRKVKTLVSAESTDFEPLMISVEAPAEVTVASVPQGDPSLSWVRPPADRAAALAAAATPAATAVLVPRDSLVAEPVWIRCNGTGSQQAAHVVVDVAAFAQATIVIDRTGSGVVTDLVDIRVGDGAEVTVVSLQDWDAETVHLGHQRHVIGRDASVKSVVVTLGGGLVRLVPSVAYDGPGGRAHLSGLYFANGEQFFEHRLFVDHSQPHCTSRVEYKGALQGDLDREAHTVWVGDVLIRAAAKGTDTYEINRNLVLTDHARADSVPNLEIETGEVTGAGHASATGRFDDEQLFYLMSRGVATEEARRLVVRGFFHEVLQQVGIDHLEARLVARVDAQLKGHGA